MRFEEALADEIASLEAQLNSDPRYMKLRELHRIRRLYERGSEPAAARDALEERDRAEFPATPKFKRRGDPRRQAALEAAIALMTGVQDPMKTGDLWEQLERQGITLGGDNPANNLSSLLYKSGKFFSFGRSGWLLRSEADKISAPAPGVSPSEVDQASELGEADAEHGSGDEAVDDNPEPGPSTASAQPEAQGREAGPGGGG